MQTEYVYPKLGDRTSPKEWAENGKPALLDRALARKEAILAEAGPTLPPEIDAAVRARWPIHF
jgi:trimethylamine--corrinoid protein Co-methyltransferase